MTTLQPLNQKRRIINATPFHILVFLLTAFIAPAVFGQNENIDYNAFLQKQSCYNTSDGVMRYIDEGEGEPIVLLHGVPTSGWVYRKMIPQLAKNGFRVIVPDMLGFGASDSPYGAAVYSPKSHAKHLSELMESLKVDEWIQVVHDAGSIWAAELIKKNPEKVSKLIVLNAVLDPSGVEWNNQIGTGIGSKFGLLLQKIGLKSSSFVSDFVVENAESTEMNMGDLRGYEAPILRGKTQGIFVHYTYMVETFLFKGLALEELNIPTRVIWGKEDDVLKWTPQKAEIKKRFNINESEIFTLPYGHLLQEEAPQKVNSLIIDFIFPE